MQLSQVVESAAADLERDGEFENLGFVSENGRKMLIFLEDRRFLGALRRNGSVSAVITTADLADGVPGNLGVLVCKDPRLAFGHIHRFLATTDFYWEDFATEIDPTAELHPTAWIAAKNVRIGAKSSVGPHVSIFERCLIGSCCAVGASAVLGGVGRQTDRTRAARMDMEYTGGIKLEDGAHVFPGAVIASGLFRQNTEIGSDARVGSQTFVSHGVHVGSNSFVGHGAVLNGNVKIGSNAWIGPGAVVAHSLAIGDDAVVSLGAVVIRHVEAGARVSGNFAIEHRSLMRSLAAISDQQSEPKGSETVGAEK